MKRPADLPKTIELIGGMLTALLALFFYAYLDLQDTGTNVTLSVRFVAFLMLVVPGIAVAIGSYLQTVRRKLWAVSLVFIGGIWSFVFVSVTLFFLFAYSQNRWGMVVVLLDLFVIGITLGAAFTNAIDRNRDQ